MKRNRTAFAVLLFLLLTSSFAVAAKKQRQWQIGTVLDSNQSRYFAGTVGNGNVNGSVNDNGSFNGSGTSSETAIYRVYQNFVLEGAQYIFVAREHLRWRWSKPADLTVNGQVKYAVEKRKLYVIDDDGKEHEMEIVKKVLRTPNSSSR